MASEAERLIDALALEPHPEGGWYRETHRSVHDVTTANGRIRSASTSIYFLLTAENFSAFHRIASDETWHFYRGDPLTIEVLHPDGTHESRRIGEGDRFQTTVAAGRFFASHVEAPGAFAVVGCDVAPGFSFDDFELADPDALRAAYPAHAALVRRFTRQRYSAEAYASRVERKPASTSEAS
jgi:predicted cupin superfamily sugar epimerase